MFRRRRGLRNAQANDDVGREGFLRGERLLISHRRAAKELHSHNGVGVYATFAGLLDMQEK